MTTEYVEYAFVMRDKDLKMYGTTFDVIPELTNASARALALKFATEQAEEQGLELVSAAKVNKTVFYDEDTDTFNTVYTGKFEVVDIYSPEPHPPLRFRDIGNAE